jgi:hypothetical protein
METRDENIKVRMSYISDLIAKYSQKASEYIHQLGIAGIVIVWVLYSVDDHKNEMHLRFLLVFALLSFITGITCSLLHYYSLAIKAEKYYHKLEKRIFKVDKNESVKTIEELHNVFVPKNKKIEKRSWFFFKTKFWCVIIGYLLILIYVILNLVNQLIQQICF